LLEKNEKFEGVKSKNSRALNNKKQQHFLNDVNMGFLPCAG